MSKRKGFYSALTPCWCALSNIIRYKRNTLPSTLAFYNHRVGIKKCCNHVSSYQHGFYSALTKCWQALTNIKSSTVALAIHNNRLGIAK